MKKFIIAISLLLALPSAEGQACVSEGPTHNRYMFSVLNRNTLNDAPAYLSAIDSYWAAYTGKTPSAGFYATFKDEIRATAQRKGDKAMAAYLTQLNRYLAVCDACSLDAWDYPTKQQLATRRQKLNAILAAAKAYRGTALRQQYTLLQMRANMMLGLDAANLTLWTAKASHFKESPWQPAMQGLYARALLKSGQHLRACDIYALIGDTRSIKAAMGNYRNLAGIKAVFAKDANSPALTYLVQDFVNNVQETLDQKPQNADDEAWLRIIDAKAIYRNEAMQFVSFAQTAADKPEVKSAAMWLSAAAMVSYLFGNQQQAAALAGRATTADGTQRMHDNARAIRLLVSTRSNKPTREYTNYLLGEMKWLDEKIAKERATASEYSNHYTDVKDRVVHKGLEPLFRAAGHDNTALALCAMMNGEESDFYTAINRAEAEKEGRGADYYDPNMEYSPWSEYFCKMDSLSADRLADYYRYLTAKHDSPFEQYCVSHSYRNADYFNDLIGTKLLAEGRFAEAAERLEKVPTTFLSRQNISVYAALRHYDTPRWFGKQRVEDTYKPVAVKRNIKLDYCRDMEQLISKYQLAREGEAKEQMAYDLAVRYYQASCYGDCWFLTHYYHSQSDSARAGEKDFAAEAVRLLTATAKSSDLNLSYRSTYALAFMPIEPWYVTTYDADYNEVKVLRPASSQYAALNALSRFAAAHPAAIDDYTRRCDVLREFQKANRP